MKQEEFNEHVTQALGQIADSLVSANKTRDALYQLIQLESARVDSAEDKIDILMNERGERIEAEEAKKDEEGEDSNFFDLLNARDDFDRSIEEHIVSVNKESLVKDLLELIKKLR